MDVDLRIIYCNRLVIFSENSENKHLEIPDDRTKIIMQQRQFFVQRILVLTPDCKGQFEKLKVFKRNTNCLKRNKKKGSYSSFVVTAAHVLNVPGSHVSFL